MIENIILIASLFSSLITISVFIGILLKPIRILFINVIQKHIKQPNYENSIKIENIENSQQLLKEGMKALLGSHIYEKSKVYIKNKEITPEQLEDLTVLYKKYKDLKGNGTVKKLYKDCKNLPTRTE